MKKQFYLVRAAKSNHRTKPHGLPLIWKLTLQKRATGGRSGEPTRLRDHQQIGLAEEGESLIECRALRCP